MTRLALVLVLGAAGIGCGLEGAFACETRDDCNDGRREGFCEIEGYCSFMDEDCGSGRRYGEYAPEDLAGVCTPEPDHEPNFLTGTDESSTDSPELDSATSPSDADGGVSEEGSSDGPRDTDANDIAESSDDGSSSDDAGGEVGDGNGGTDEDGGSSSSGADEEPQDCNARDCASCLDCVAAPSGPCRDEATACTDAAGCTAGVACNHSCLLTGLCFEDCCYDGVESLIDDVVMCGADHCIDACNRYEFLTCG